MPGDVPKKVKIAMMEGKWENINRSKSFRKMVYMKMKAVLKERAKQEIKMSEQPDKDMAEYD